MSNVQFSGFLAKKKVDFALSFYREEIHITKTVRELLFDGYEDHLINAANTYGLLGGKKSPEKIGYMYNVSFDSN